MIQCRECKTQKEDEEFAFLRNNGKRRGDRCRECGRRAQRKGVSKPRKPPLTALTISCVDMFIKGG